VQAVILAAGRGSRLGDLTSDRPKPLLPLAGVPLLQRLLASLREAGLAPVTIVTGYRAGLIAAHAPGCVTIRNPRWRHTGIAASLLAAADAGTLARDDTIVTYADIVAEPAVFTAAVRAPAAPVCVPVNTGWLPLWQARMPDPLRDAERLILGENGTLLDIGGIPRSLDQIHAQFMGIIRLSPPGAASLAGFYRHARGRRESAARWDTTTLLASWLRAGGTAATVPVPGGWLEVDTPADRDCYETLHAAGQLASLCNLDATIPEGTTPDAP
jgi:choline kinase